jgi:hypothetical protein
MTTEPFTTFLVHQKNRFQVASSPDALGATYTLIGTFPKGITMTSKGVLHGIPASTGTFTGYLFVRNSLGASADSFTLVVGQHDPNDGYWMAASNGTVYAFGKAKNYGSPSSHDLKSPIIAFASTPNGGGYWEVASNGGVFAFGNARFLGSMSGKSLAGTIVGFASTSDGKGYWEVSSTGSVYAFGNASFEYGYTSHRAVGIASMADNRGYVLENRLCVGFTFGTAVTRPWLPPLRQTDPVPKGNRCVGIALAPGDLGISRITTTGAVISAGSVGNVVENGALAGAPFVAFAYTPLGHGYYEITSNGKIVARETALDFGTLSTKKLSSPIVGFALS